MAPEEQQKQIDALLLDSVVAKKWTEHCRDLFGLVHFLKNSGVYSLYAEGNLGKGDFNIYRMFVELALRKIRIGGFAAQVVPAGFYGGANASAIRRFVFDENTTNFIAGCENKGSVFFPGVHPQTWFALYSVTRGGATKNLRLTFGVDTLHKASCAYLSALDLDSDVIRKLSPETYAIPDIRDLAQLKTSKKLYSAGVPFGSTDLGPPIRHYSREIDMGNDRGLFSTDRAGLPVYEGRMIDHFDHRAKTYASGHGNSAVWIEREFGDPAKAIIPQWRVLRENIPGKLGSRCDRYRIGFGDVANPRNQRTFISTLIPPDTICGHTVPTFMFEHAHEWAYLPWLAVANSFAMDALARGKLSSPHMTFTVLDSLPFPRPALIDKSVQDLAPVVLRLICTAPEMTSFWNSMARQGLVPACGTDEVPPSAHARVVERESARAFLDAYVAKSIFHLTRQELADMLDTFEAYRNSDMRAHQEFRTKRLILDEWERQ
jgi:hypothetical protein